MLCPGLCGIDFIGAAVAREFGTFDVDAQCGAVLESCLGRANRWCPKWTRRNYEVENKLLDDPESDEASEDPDVPSASAPPMGMPQALAP